MECPQGFSKRSIEEVSGLQVSRRRYVDRTSGNEASWNRGRILNAHIPHLVPSKPLNECFGETIQGLKESLRSRRTHHSLIATSEICMRRPSFLDGLHESHIRIRRLLLFSGVLYIISFRGDLMLPPTDVVLNSASGKTVAKLCKACGEILNGSRTNGKEL